MEADDLYQKSLAYLNKLCVEIGERSVGSAGNRVATQFFAQEVSSLGWQIEMQEFAALDWEDGGASLQVGEDNFAVFASPYSLGCAVDAQLEPISSIEELAHAQIRNKIVLLHGEIAKEQLMPKNFVFYNPEEHQLIIALLEQGAPVAIVCATGRNAALAGGSYPFPLIEDGDFDIPSVYMTEEEGRKLLPHAREIAALKSVSRRIPGTGWNIIASKGNQPAGRIVFTAHIDAKKGTPGAIDNASGVIVLLLLAGLLRDHDGECRVEIVALNGEDYYAVPGQMLYLRNNSGRFHEILLNINIDGAGYHEGPSAFSFYGLSGELEGNIKDALKDFPGIAEGSQWPQGDHSMFIQNGCPAVAVSSQWFTENIDHQEITHTPKDAPEIVDCRKLVEIARALEQIVRKVNFPRE